MESKPADNRSKRIQRNQQEHIQKLPDFSWCEDVGRVEDFFQKPHIPKPIICGTDNGVSKRVDRLKCLGNAVVPQQAALAWRILTNSGGKLTDEVKHGD